MPKYLSPRLQCITDKQFSNIEHSGVRNLCATIYPCDNASAIGGLGCYDSGTCPHGYLAAMTQVPVPTATVPTAICLDWYNKHRNNCDRVACWEGFCGITGTVLGITGTVLAIIFHLLQLLYYSERGTCQSCKLANADTK